MRQLSPLCNIKSAGHRFKGSDEERQELIDCLKETIKALRKKRKPRSD